MFLVKKEQEIRRNPDCGRQEIKAAKARAIVGAWSLIPHLRVMDDHGRDLAIKSVECSGKSRVLGTSGRSVANRPARASFGWWSIAEEAAAMKN
jgi:hypothetical protein